MGGLGKDKPGTGRGRPRVRRGMDISTLGRNHGDHAKGLMWVLFSVSCLLSPSRSDSSIFRPGTAGSSGLCQRGHSINCFSSHPSSLSY